MFGYRSNPLVRIVVDRDATNAARARYGSRSIIATFLDPVTLYRVLDDDELARIAETGEIVGGLFAIPGERAYGASWSATITKLPEWGQGWQDRRSSKVAYPGRLGKNLFVARINAYGRLFYHMGFRADSWDRDPLFDPRGSRHQPALIYSEECNTGSGCSTFASIDEAGCSIEEASGRCGRRYFALRCPVAHHVPQQTAARIWNCSAWTGVARKTKPMERSNRNRRGRRELRSWKMA